MSVPEFQPLLFGGDINVYSVARAFHEAYGVKSIVYGKILSFPCAYSSIIDFRPCAENEDEETFLRNVKQVAAEFERVNYAMSVEVPEMADPSTLTAKIENGILTVAMKKRPETQPRKIEIL